MGLLECSKLDLNLFKHLSCIIVFVKLMALNYWSIEVLSQAGHKLMDDSLSWSISFLHLVILLFELFKFPLIVEALLLLHDLLLPVRRLVFIEEPFGLVVHEVTKNLKGILLLNLFLFKQLCDFGNSLSDILKQVSLLIPLLRQDAYFGLCLVLMVINIPHLNIKALDLIPQISILLV